MRARQLELGRIITPAKLKRAGSDDYPVLSMTMRDGLVDQSAKFKKRVASADTSPYKVVKRKQLVVGFPIDEGVLAFQDLYDEAIVSPAYDIWDIQDHSIISCDYLQRFLRSPVALSFYSAKLRGTTARRRTLPDDVFLTLPVPLPPLAEQRRIAEVLDKAEALRAKRRAALAQLDCLTQSLFLDLFGDPATNPKGWPVRRLGELIVDGPQNGLYKPSTDYGSGTPILRIDAFYDGAVTDISALKRVRLSEAERSGFRLTENDVVINRVNSLEYLGKCALIPKLPEETVFESNMMRMRFDSKTTHPRFVVQFLQSGFAKSQIQMRAKHAVNQASINQQDVSGFRTSVPPIQLQREFARRVAAVGKLKTAQRAALAELDALFASLQHRAFRGEL